MQKKWTALLLCAVMLLTGVMPAMAAAPAAEIETAGEALKTITGIKITNYPKENYYQYLDTELSYEGLEVTITYADETTETLCYGQESSKGDTISIFTTFDFAKTDYLNGYCPVVVSVGGHTDRYSVGYGSFDSAVKKQTITVHELSDASQSYVVTAKDYLKTSVYEFTTASDDRRMVFVTSGHAKYDIYRKSDMSLQKSWEGNNKQAESVIKYLEADTGYYLIVRPVQETDENKVTVSRGTLTVTNPENNWEEPGKDISIPEQPQNNTDSKAAPAAQEVKVFFDRSAYTVEATAKRTAVLKSTRKNDAVTSVASKAPAIARVSYSGNKVTITGVKAGKTTMTAKTKSGKTVTASITVTTPKVTLNQTLLPLQVNKSSTAVAVKKKIATDSVAKWSSSNTKIMKVNAKTGKMTAKKAGTAYVKVTMKSGATAKCKVKVQKAAVKTKKLTLNKTKVTLKVKKTFQVKAAKTPVTSLEKVTYKSSNTKVATVSTKGKITAKKAGKATITVKAGTKTKKITVTVRK